MRTRMFAAIAAGILALIGVAAMVAYANGAQDRALDNAEMVSVYRAVAEIPAGTAASELGSNVELVELPKLAVAENPVSDLARIDGDVTTGALYPGEQLVEGRFAAPGAAAGAEGIPEGLQLVTVSLPSDRATGGVIAAGTRVGLLSTANGDKGLTSNMFAQNVLVSKVDGGEQGALVTLAVDGKLATKLAGVVDGGGTLRLTVQNEKTNRDAGGPFVASNLVK